EADVVVEEIAGGRTVYAGAGSPLTETKAIGLHGPVTDADFELMEAVCFSRGEPSRVVVCPLADPSLVEGLAEGRCRLPSLESILTMPLGGFEPGPAPSPLIEVRPIEPSETQLYASVVGPNFVAPGQSSDDVMEMMTNLLAIGHASSFLARIGGEAVG